MYAKHIAVHLGRSVSSIEKKAAKLGLKSKVAGSLPFQNTHNKGKSWRPKEQHHSWREVGEIWEAAGRKYTKLPSGEIVSYAREVMKRRGYDVVGMVVRHRDGNPMNCEVDNLEVITLGENGARNSRNCKDPEMRAIRARIAQTGESIVDMVLQGFIR